jgi:major vault protein
MAPEMGGRDRDLILNPGEFAFVSDTTKGLVSVIVGPNKTSMSGTDQPVKWDDSQRRFIRSSFEEAVQPHPNAPEGYYLVLGNPIEAHGSGRDEHPREGVSSAMTPLRQGRRINIPGPAHFPLWPGQTAKVIAGHDLRSNQYLLVRVYNDEEARTNWGNAVVKRASTSKLGTPAGSGGSAETGDTITHTPSATPLVETSSAVPEVPPVALTMGQLMVIQGTDVAFFIPPTGLEVVPESQDKYVREAVTLERLDYCILLSENGTKRYVRGPAVVFPEPTETFVVKDGERKFRAIELNVNSGIYVKVIADYEDGGKQYKVGEELFITGMDQAIYFPREEHSIIKYGDQTIHYAVAVPAGEGRYILDRNKGQVTLVKGPKMLLPDPRSQVIVRRFLAAKTVELWYPGNTRVLEVNKELEQLSKGRPAGEYLESASSRGFAPSTMRGLADDSLVADTFNRSTKYTPPRTITLDTKYEGAVAVTVWTGYAVLIVNKTGNRRVVMGPQTILLEYDETLAPLELSTGTPKTDANLFRTVYLRVQNNKVSDVVRVETSDLVPVDVTLSYRVNFEGEDKDRWFAVENYIRLLVDHLRSLIRNAAKHQGIEKFYGNNAIDVIRDAVLGAASEDGPRPGRLFEENAMRVYDVEVLDVKITNSVVNQMLSEGQTASIKASLQISRENLELEGTKHTEETKRAKAEEIAKTASNEHGLAMEKIASAAQATMQRLKDELEEKELRNNLNSAAIARQQAQDDQRLAAKKAEIETDLALEKGRTDQIVSRAAAINDNLVTALTTFSDQSLVEKVVTALGPMSAMNGVSAFDIVGRLFKDTHLGELAKGLGARARVPMLGLSSDNGETQGNHTS